MNQFNSRLMHAYLLNIRQQGEDYKYPIYVGFGPPTKLSTSAINNLYGFIAITNQNRLLVAQFNIMAQLVAHGSFPLERITSLKINKLPLTQIYSIKIEFDLDGKKQKLNMKANKKVYLTDLKDQEQNLESLINDLQMWG